MHFSPFWLVVLLSLLTWIKEVQECDATNVKWISRSLAHTNLYYYLFTFGLHYE